jgi:hypothetical protein
MGRKAIKYKQVIATEALSTIQGVPEKFRVHLMPTNDLSGITRRFIELAVASRPTLQASQLSIQCASGAVSMRIKWPGREANRLPPSSAEVKNGGAIPPRSPVSFHGAMIN